MSVYVCILITAAAAGLLAGFITQKILLSRLPGIISRMATGFAAKAIDPKMITSALSSKVNFDDIRPLVEEHVDEFLGHKLGKEMPMIGMFIGDKTIAQMKTIFMKELEEIFPLVMGKYVEGLSRNFDGHTLLTENTSGAASFAVRDINRKILRFIPLYMSLSALGIGLIQVLILVILA